MISKRINRKLFHAMLLQDLPRAIFWDGPYQPDSHIFQCAQFDKPVTPMVDEFLQVFDAETLAEVQKNVSLALTASKHLLMYDKQDLIWFQKTLARMKNARGAFKD